MITITSYVNSKTLLDLYYALVYPFLTYCIIAWGNTYQTSLQPLFVLQKKAIRIITFSGFFEHTSPLFKDLNVIKLFDEVTVHIAVFMYKFKNRLLPTNFNVFFTSIKETHSYNTRLSSRMTYALPKTRTNYGVFNIRYQGAKIWNAISDNIKLLSLKQFKKKLKSVNLRRYISFSCLFSLNCILSLKLVFVCVFLCCYICYLKKYMTLLKITVIFKTLRMAAQFY